ncbi:MAG: precorrin-2 C(20)-methyltransferase [Synergistaceae bacterium]|jgi:precorrin-2/cobalt-factor-2 C20-methyltransferase|nr:precorrin-2 C(20)-methyltransferase [Synergistaceae bacterium]
MLIFYGVGVGPGDPDMVTTGAKRALDEADVVLVPVSSLRRASLAGEIYSKLSPKKATHPFFFPMTDDAAFRDREILRQLDEYSALWKDASSVALPVIGDAALYSTVAYIYAVWRSLCPKLELKLLPGVSAHSLAACAAGEFLALGDERLAVLPGSADFSKLSETMAVSDCVALYKPSALKGKLRDLLSDTGPWKRAVRVHRAGLPDQYVVTGGEALRPTDDYLSVLLLWRAR